MYLMLATICIVLHVPPYLADCMPVMVPKKDKLTCEKYIPTFLEKSPIWVDGPHLIKHKGAAAIRRPVCIEDPYPKGWSRNSKIRDFQRSLPVMGYKDVFPD